MPPVNMDCPVCKRPNPELKQEKAARWLADHLIAQHCDPNPDGFASGALLGNVGVDLSK